MKKNKFVNVKSVNCMDAFLVHMFTPDQISLASQPLVLQGYAAYLYQIIVIVNITIINTGTDRI